MWKNFVQFRALRKLSGTHLNLMGTDPRTIQEMYRHSSLDMTQIYVGVVVPAAVQTASERLDGAFGGIKSLDDSLDYTPRYKKPKYQELIEK